ncbi:MULTISPECIES: potassium channel family protein [unclassified Gordonia (in: high G+C Gram-positive bacteria)]|uniref:potassium channel family protein n=1 Tax=unclassified Gordonia (in: high G+C Gram-positive bacteria) TaxID=2657482 RepID=UPI0020002E85|nr:MULTISPECIES: potassium channel family protein [unclassified Gordonia (in: high G+C Gram-positive bacteria)]UQE74904.1 potassium channel family protein [Gordonia sp. PP30]
MKKLSLRQPTTTAEEAPLIKTQGPIETAALDNVNAGWLTRALLRPLFAACVLVIGYFLLPFNHTSDWNVAASVAGSLLLLAFCVWEVRAFLHATYPLAAALEMLAALVTLYLVSFSTIYFTMSDYHPGSFNQHLTRMDALYYCLTVFTTTGFGDIDAVTQGARIAVSIQMICNLILIGLGFRLFSMVVTARLRASPHNG